MPRGLKFIMILGGVLFCLSLAALVVLATVSRARPLAPKAESSVADLRLPDFSLIDQNEQPVSRSAFKGRVTIVDFMFTHCPFICPRLTGQMLEMSKALTGTPVRFASFSVDPVHDTPARLREYATEKGIDLTRWSLLTGEQAVIDSIVKGALKFELAEDTRTPITLPDGSSMNNITHPGHFVVIGPEGQVLAMRRSSEPDAVAQIVQIARDAAARLP
ncbi:MAG: SCO family protein [Phycisphaerales bacterium]